MTVVPSLLVGLCLIVTAYAGDSQASVKQGDSLRSERLGPGTAQSKASSCSAGGYPIPPVVAKGCPPKSYESFGVISSSQYPNNYTYRLHCTYQLKAVDEGSTVQLWFGAFDTEHNYDVVDIYDGTSARSPRLKTLSGQLSHYLPTTSFNSTGQFMYVVFWSDGIVNRPGWFATFSSVRKRAPAYTCSN